MKPLLLALAAFFALSIPASAGDPNPIASYSNAAWWTKPIDGSLASLHVAAVANPQDRVQIHGLYAEVYSLSTGAQGEADSTAIVGMAYGANANGYANGAYLETHAQVPGAHGVGAEIRSGNFTGTHALYTPSYASRLVGLWLTTAGMDSSAAIQVGNIPPSKWKVGLGFTSGAVADASIRDDSQSQISIDVRGMHETAIRVARGAGKVVFDAPVWINGKLIELGPPDSCGVGYRCLRVGN